MNSLAVDTFSTFGVGVLCIALAIMLLTLFYRVLAWISNPRGEPEPLTVRGVLKEDTWATVYMTGTKTFERVRFLGYMSSESTKYHLPHELNGMVILEDEAGSRFLVRAKAIRMIVIAQESKGAGVKEL